MNETKVKLEKILEKYNLKEEDIKSLTEREIEVMISILVLLIKEIIKTIENQNEISKETLGIIEEIIERKNIKVEEVETKLEEVQEKIKSLQKQKNNKIWTRIIETLKLIKLYDMI